MVMAEQSHTIMKKAVKPITTKKTGATSRYTVALATQFCALIASGLSTRKEGAKMGVSPSVVRTWLIVQPKFRTHYARARSRQTVTRMRSSKATSFQN